MKVKDIKDLSIDRVSQICIENIFNVYIDNEVLDDQYYYNITESVVIPTDLDEEYYFDYYVQQGDTWPVLAFRFYGDVRAWWLICKANNILDPTAHPEGGTKLKILNRNVAREILGSINNV